MKKDSVVRLEKLEASPAAAYPTSDKEDWEEGVINWGKSLPVGYWLEGTLLDDIKVGESVLLFRHVRNGITVSGITQTSPVASIVGDILLTQNSIYRMTLVKNDTLE